MIPSHQEAGRDDIVIRLVFCFTEIESHLPGKAERLVAIRARTIEIDPQIFQFRPAVPIGTSQSGGAGVDHPAHFRQAFVQRGFVRLLVPDKIVRVASAGVRANKEQNQREGTSLKILHRCPARCRFGAGGGTRTRTGLTPQGILSPLCLPFHHAGLPRNVAICAAATRPWSALAGGKLVPREAKNRATQ